MDGRDRADAVHRERAGVVGAVVVRREPAALDAQRVHQPLGQPTAAVDVGQPHRRAGGTTERLVDPLRIEGGWLTAYDHRADDTRTFGIHRISAVSPVRAK
ncbi:MAG TPA: hypothetical protein VHG70_08515 [Nocardioidaceae bacterium]|nr:hypothetical protein [Nocardioidaceae bacterium]